MISLAAVLAILTAIGPVLELNAAGLHILAPLIQQRLLAQAKQKHNVHYHQQRDDINESVHRTCLHFRCSE
jgi:hypothetical protein